MRIQRYCELALGETGALAEPGEAGVNNSNTEKVMEEQVHEPQADNRSYRRRSRTHANETLQQLGKIYGRRLRSSRQANRQSAKQLFNVVGDIMSESEWTPWSGWIKFSPRTEDAWQRLMNALGVALAVAATEGDAARRQLTNSCVYMYRATAPAGRQHLESVMGAVELVREDDEAHIRDVARKIERDGAYADNTSMYAFTKIKRVAINIYQQCGDKVKLIMKGFGNRGDDMPLRVLYSPETLHYHMLGSDGTSIVRVMGDGNCFFVACLRQMEGTHHQQAKWTVAGPPFKKVNRAALKEELKQVRKEVADYIRANAQHITDWARHAQVQAVRALEEKDHGNPFAKPHEGFEAWWMENPV